MSMLSLEEVLCHSLLNPLDGKCLAWPSLPICKHARQTSFQSQIDERYRNFFINLLIIIIRSVSVVNIILLLQVDCGLLLEVKFSFQKLELVFVSMSNIKEPLLQLKPQKRPGSDTHINISALHYLINTFRFLNLIHGVRTLLKSGYGILKKLSLIKKAL